MSRRKRKPGPITITNGFMTEARDNLRRLELAVAYQTVKIEFTSMDVARWLLPPAHLELLAAVFPVLKDGDRTQFSGEIALLNPYPSEFGEYPVNVVLDVNFRALNIAAPDSSVIELQGLDGPIPKALVSLHNIHAQWSVVHEAIEWLDINATVGAARNYFPALTALLPSTHAIHDVDGQRYREPQMSVGPMIPKFRAAGMTVAGALLCPLDVPSRTIVTACFGGRHAATFGLCE